MGGGQIIVSQKGFDSPESLASEIVEQLLAYVTTSDLILSIRPDLINAAAKAGVDRHATIELARRINADVGISIKRWWSLSARSRLRLRWPKRGAAVPTLATFVDTVLARIAEKSARGEYEAAAAEADNAFAQWEQDEGDRREGALQAGLALIDAGLKQDILRRDAGSAAGQARRTHGVSRASQP